MIAVASISRVPVSFRASPATAHSGLEHGLELRTCLLVAEYRARVQIAFVPGNVTLLSLAHQ